jgi:hypothetical protein
MENFLRQKKSPVSSSTGACFAVAWGITSLHLVWGERSISACVSLRGGAGQVSSTPVASFFLSHESTRQKKALYQRGSGLALLLLGEFQACMECGV